MENNTIHGKHHSERVSSTYAEIYFDHLYCNSENEVDGKKLNINQQNKNGLPTKIITPDKHIEDWKSPSDQLIGIIDLKSPFTSKITRGKTHKGILSIGNEILEEEQLRFLKHINNLIQENDAAWNFILQYEKSLVSKRVNDIYGKIFLTKSKKMTEEINKFYESTLQELEDHLRSEIQTILVSAHTSITSDLNSKIKVKMDKEKNILENVLKKRYKSEIQKITKYYEILLNHENNRIKKLVNNEIIERNDALKAFYKLIEAENMTSTMYVMSTERKKCRIKKFLLENYHSTEMAEMVQQIKQKQAIVDAFKDKNILISDINKDWEEKIRNILRLFLKFISFALKLLPEQTTFLLDLEKLLVLQLNEIQKVPSATCSILVDEEKIENIFKFEECVLHKHSCDTKPLVVVGDTSDLIPPKYGSRETLPPDVDLPIIRLQRQYVYAKCHGYEEIKALLESQKCKCAEFLNKQPSFVTLPSKNAESVEGVTPIANESSNETLLVDDIIRVGECPAKLCNKWTKRITFPYLDNYLDFTEENFQRVQTILSDEHVEAISSSEIIKAKNIAHKSLQFETTNEVYRFAGTQCSSMESIIPDIKCSCIGNNATKDSQNEIQEITSKSFDDILIKRRNSLRRIMQNNPKLLEIFTDESFDFVI